MPTTHPEVLVLWAERFDEAATAHFVTEFRRAGLRTKLVSLASKPSPGAHGLVLLPDWTLEEALSKAHGVRCVVVPTQAAGLQRVHNDPRVETLLGWLAAESPVFVVGPMEARPLAQQAGLAFIEWGDETQREEVIQRVISYLRTSARSPEDAQDSGPARENHHPGPSSRAGDFPRLNAALTTKTG